jgi:hypothetical protein
MKSHLFQALPIGALFFRDPFNKLENPSIKVDDTHARNPKGCVIKVNGGVLVFTPGLKTYIPNPEDQIVISLPILVEA